MYFYYNYLYIFYIVVILLIIINLTIYIYYSKNTTSNYAIYKVRVSKNIDRYIPNYRDLVLRNQNLYNKVFESKIRVLVSCLVPSALGSSIGTTPI